MLFFNFSQNHLLPIISHLEVREELYRGPRLAAAAVLGLEAVWLDEGHLGAGGHVHHGVVVQVLSTTCGATEELWDIFNFSLDGETFRGFQITF